jgi:uncharacterized protein (DUF3084 family)
MKTILPWLIAVLALGGAFFFYNSNQSKSAEVAKLQAEVQQLDSLRSELTELKTQQVAPAELAQLRKDKEDLLRLRNEVGKLRSESQQLAKQAQSAQTALAAVQQQQVQTLQQLQTENQQLRGAAQQAQQIDLLNACINQLRQLDGAKQQWALENTKAADAVPTAQEIAPYLRDQVLPACPAAGKYTLNAVSVAPTCSIAGHALPQP